MDNSGGQLQKTLARIGTNALLDMVLISYTSVHVVGAVCALSSGIVTSFTYLIPRLSKHPYTNHYMKLPLLVHKILSVTVLGMYVPNTSTLQTLKGCYCSCVIISVSLLGFFQ